MVRYRLKVSLKNSMNQVLDDREKTSVSSFNITKSAMDEMKPAIVRAFRISFPIFLLF